MPITLSIPKPCQEDWQAMTKQSENSRFCENCRHIVQDFSQMTDAELLQYFKHSPKVHCGRFHHLQLEREIISPVNRRGLFLRFHKAAAAIMTILSLRTSHAKAESRNNFSALEQVMPNKDQSTDTESDEIIISGKVLDESGKPIANAKIFLDSIQAFSKADGSYLFTLNKRNLAQHNLYFSFEELMPVVRSYHPAMGAATYDVVLVKRRTGGYSMGMPALSWSNLSLPGICFSKGAVLENEEKLVLENLAEQMKMNPQMPPVLITGYAKSAPHLQLTKKRIEVIKRFLEDKCGIAAERLVTEIERSHDDTAIMFSVVDL